MLAASEALGQSSPILLPETRSLRAGPVSVYPTIALRDAGIDSNVYNDPTGPKSDFTYSLTPRLYVAMPAANTRFVGRGLGALTYYSTYKDQQAISGLFDGRYEVTSPGVRPFASAGFANRRERRGEIDARLRQRQMMASAGTDVDLTAITAITAWVGRTSTRWDRHAEYAGLRLSDQLNYTRNAFGAGARFRLTPLTRVTLAAEVERDRFGVSSFRDANSLKVGPRVDFETTAMITGHMAAAYRAFRPLNSSFTSFGGLIASSQLRYQFREWTEVNVEADRDVDYSYDPLQPYSLASGGRVEVTQQLIGPFRAIAIGDRRDFDHQMLGERGFTGRREVTRTLGGGIAVVFRKQFRFEMLYEQTSRTSSDSQAREYERQRMLVSAIYGQ
jgi:hypothetical protein